MAKFFISRAGEDKNVGYIIDEILRNARHKTFIQGGDFGFASFMDQMAQAFAMVDEGAKLIALLSPDYQQKEHCKKEAHYPLIDDPNNKLERLIVLRVRKCEPTGFLKDIPYIDLFPFNISSDAFRFAVLAAVAPNSGRERDNWPISIPISVKLNKPDFRQAAIGNFAKDLRSSPLSETRFVNYFDYVEEVSWLNGSGLVQTTSVELKELWADPRYFIAFEASLLLVRSKGLDVQRLFILGPEVQTDEGYRSRWLNVIVRHYILGLNPRVLVRPDALLLNKEIGIDCDAFMVVDSSTCYLLKVNPWNDKRPLDAPPQEPIALRTTNRAICVRSSNIHYTYWNLARDAVYLLHRWGPVSRKYMKIIEEQANRVLQYRSFYVDRDTRQ